MINIYKYCKIPANAASYITVPFTNLPFLKLLLNGCILMLELESNPLYPDDTVPCNLGLLLSDTVFDLGFDNIGLAVSDTVCDLGLVSVTVMAVL